MPVPKHTFAPPFNIVRSSHIALGVSDLGRSRAFYADTLGLIVEDAEQDTVYLRGVEVKSRRRSPGIWASKLGRRKTSTRPPNTSSGKASSTLLTSAPTKAAR